jgi:DNA-binding transcriptional LysR family regulator
VDLNLLPVLDALLQESSVTRAAERLGSSPAAVSRTLARLRRLCGDPLLVRAGQRLVPTPRALELREEVRALVEHTDRLFRPAEAFDPGTLRRRFTVQAADGVLTALAGPLLHAVGTEAPDVEVVFLPEALEGGPGLRDGTVDVELGVLDHLDPEVLGRPVSRLPPLIGVARTGHPLFDGPIDARRYAAAEHIGVSRQGRRHGPVDDALAGLGLSRTVRVVLPSHTSALLLARASDLLAITFSAGPPGELAALGLRGFDIPLRLPALEIGIAWHPRNTADPGHAWFREHLALAVRELSAMPSGCP